jgi:3'5'-cyclic nucleotide phosphodiesterase
MESSGEPNRIHVSQKTADLIEQAGKGYVASAWLIFRIWCDWPLPCVLCDRKWLTPRSEQVNCKGKGLMSTFWVEPSASSIPDNEIDSQQSHKPAPVSKVDGKSRMILGDEIAKKLAVAPQPSPATERLVDWTMGLFLALLEKILVLRRTNTNSFQEQVVDSSETLVSTIVKEQLRQYISCVAKLHRHGEFHNFEHACHVVMATNNLLSAVTDSDQTSMVSWLGAMDPVTELALLFAALVHDVERDAQAVVQQSVDVAWGLLMEPQFAQLQTCLFATNSEREKFRQTVLEAVLATDLSDKDLDAERWEKQSMKDPSRLTKTIVQLTMRAAVVSHAMQHFTIYKKWCIRNLVEMRQSRWSSSGRLAAVDPTETWYEEELALFDDYVIPLATKLTACGLFGAAGEDFLAYARDNRMEWEAKGRDIINDIKPHI